MLYSSKHKIQTSDWLNNCALHCVAETLQELLSTRENADFWATAPYQKLLQSIAVTTGLEEQTWKSVNDLTEKLHPADSEKIWGYAIRKILSSLLIDISEYRDQLFNSFRMLVNTVVEQGQINFEEDVNLSRSNENFLIEVRSYVQNNPNENFDDLLDEQYVRTYWVTHGYRDYCEYLSGLLEASHEEKILGLAFPMITAEELAVICKSLRLNLSVYSYEGSNESEVNYERPYSVGVDVPDAIARVTVVNEGNHWESLAPSENSAVIKSFLKTLQVEKVKEKNRFDHDIYEFLRKRINENTQLPRQLTDAMKSLLESAIEQGDFDYILMQCISSIKASSFCLNKMSDTELSRKLIERMKNMAPEVRETIIRISNLKEELLQTEGMTPLIAALLYDPVQVLSDMIKNGVNLTTEISHSIIVKIFTESKDRPLPEKPTLYLKRFEIRSYAISKSASINLATSFEC